VRGVADTELIPEALGLLSATLEKHPERIELVCSALRDLEHSRRLPKDAVGAGGAMFEDARSGAYDTVEALLADVVHALRPYRGRYIAT